MTWWEKHRAFIALCSLIVVILLLNVVFYSSCVLAFKWIIK